VALAEDPYGIVTVLVIRLLDGWKIMTVSVISPVLVVVLAAESVGMNLVVVVCAFEG
jgi:hypothetical protein